MQGVPLAGDGAWTIGGLFPAGRGRLLPLRASPSQPPFS